MTVHSILLVDDDQELCALLQDWLEQDGFHIHAVHDAQSAQQRLTEQLPEAVILDVMLPDGNGLELLRTLRHDYAELPVLMLSARGEPTDRILGLELGADDYMAKPCDPRELPARLKAVLRRSAQPDSSKADSSAQALKFEDLHYNPNTGVLLLGDTEVSLTLSEGKVLEVLLQQPGEPIDKHQLTERALGRKLTLYDRSIDMHISNLRKKLGLHANGQPRILSIRGRGYYYTRSE